MPGQRRPVPYKNRDQLAEAMRAAVLATPSAANHDAMANALRISPRTLYRLRKEFNVPWPPFDDWEELLRLAGAALHPEDQPREMTSWLVSFRITQQRWVTATSVEEAIAKLRAEIGPQAVITSVQPG
jgi:hypothetical protein